MSVQDLVVVLPGIMGSTLSRDGEPVWEPSAGAALRAVRTFGRSLQDLRLPDGLGDEAPDDGVEAVSLMPDLHVLPGIWTVQVGYDLLLSWLQQTFQLVPHTKGGPPGNLLAVPYDWRLSNRYNGRRLKALVEPALERWRAQGGQFADARVVFICHSMGGLVARWYIQCEGGAEITRKLITIGTPHRGATNALTQLVNGVHKGPWPFRIDLTEFARSLPSIHQLLPEYACLESSSGLVKTTETSLPEVSNVMVADAMKFHDELDVGDSPWWDGGFAFHPIQGQLQQTATTARLVNGTVVPSPLIEGENLRGDGTVPALSALPKGLALTSPVVRHVTERHGVLQHNRSVFDELEGVLTASQAIYRAPATTPVDLRIEDVFEAGEPIDVEAVFPNGGDVPLEARLVAENGRVLEQDRLRRRDDKYVTSFDPPTAGAYRVQLGGSGNAARALVSEVTAPVLVWDVHS